MCKYTNSNPGCYHSMIGYLSQLSGISEKKFIYFDRLQGLRNKSGKQLMYHADSIIVIGVDGSEYGYMQGEKRFDQCGIEAYQFKVEVYRNQDEFGIEIKNAGKYDDSLGGGWHCTISLVRINDKYFAPLMECAHR